MSAAPAPRSAEALVTAALLAFCAGDRELALSYLDRVAGLAGKSELARAWRARFLRESGRVREALASLDGFSPSARAYAAEIRASFHDDEGALRELDAALALSPRVFSLHLARAAALERRGRLEEARGALKAALSAENTSAAGRIEVARRLAELGADDFAVDLLRAELSGERGALARALLARIFVWRGNTESASALADEALVMDPDEAIAHLVRGAVFVLSGGYRDALSPLNRAIELADDLYEAFVFRAEAYYRLGESSLALADLERASDQIGDYFAAHVLRLLVAIRSDAARSRLPFGPVESVYSGVTALVPGSAPELDSGDPSRVAQILEVTLAALSGNRSPVITTARAEGQNVERIFVAPSPRYAAKWTLETIVGLPFEEVFRRFDDVLRDHPRSSKPYCYRGELLLWMGEPLRARLDFERAIEIDIATRWAYVGLVASFLLEGRDDEALAAALRGERFVVPGPTMYVYRGEAHRRRGDLPAALADLEVACRMNPSRVSAWMNLALVHNALGDHEGKRAALDRLAWQAPFLLRDAAASFGPGLGPADIDPARLLERGLVMMRGNRSSTCITYFVGEELRVVPFIPRAGESPMRRELSRRKRVAPAAHAAGKR